MSPMQTPVFLLPASILLAACAGSPFDAVTGVRSMCDVPFEEGKTVQVSGVFGGDRYHYSFFYDDACPGKIWQADYEEPFDSKYEDELELGNAIVIGPAYRHFKIEVEGRLYVNYEGKPGIEFLKLGRIVERLKEPE